MAAGAFAAVLVAVWLIADPRTPDLAAQVYRADLFGKTGFAVWDDHWYGGHPLPGYSLLFPPLGWRSGCACWRRSACWPRRRCSSGCSRAAIARAAPWGAAWFAVGAVGDSWIGRLSFALGVTLACGAALALVHGGPSSPPRSPSSAPREPGGGPAAGAGRADGVARSALAAGSVRVGLPGGALVLALVVLFPEGGWEPFPLLSFLATALVAVGFLWALPRGERLLRTGALCICWVLLCLAIRSPVGSNIARYGVLLGGPLLLCATLERAARGRGPAVRTLRGGGARGERAVGARAGNGGGERERRDERRLLRAGRGLPGAPARRARAGRGAVHAGHWEAALLAPKVSLARGWEKQLDERYDRVLLRSGLTAGQYRQWLREQAVAYVALPDAPLDPSSARRDG